MNPELLLAVERMLKMFGTALKYAKPVTTDLVELWAVVLGRMSATPEEVASLTVVALSKTTEFPAPADGLNWLGVVRNEAQRLKLTDMRRAELDGKYNCLTTPDQVKDGRVVAKGQGNGVPLDELGQLVRLRKALGRPITRSLNVRQLLQALPRNTQSVMSESEVRDRDEQIKRLKGDA